MKFNELELKKIIKNYSKNQIKKLSIEEEININILNFIHTIHLNKQDFYASEFGSKYFGDLEMSFNKKADCLIGHCRVQIKQDSRIIDYLFTENGYELLSDIMKKSDLGLLVLPAIAVQP